MMSRTGRKRGGSTEDGGPPGRRNRRQAMALAGAAAAAATVAALGVDRGKKAHAAPGDPLILGLVFNDSGAEGTGLTAALKAPSPPGPVFEPDFTLGVGNTAPTPGIDQTAKALSARSNGEGVAGFTAGDGPHSVGVFGASVIPGPPGESEAWGPAPGVVGQSGSGPGVSGHSESGPGVAGQTRSANPEQAGVRGHSLSADPDGPPGGPAIGVEGTSFEGIGVRGNSVYGPGVAGRSETASGVRGFSSSTAGGAGVKGITTGETPPSPLPNKPVWGVAGASLKPGADWQAGPLPNPDDLGEGIGVWGVSGAGIGLRGDSLGVAGIWGSAPADHPGVLAFSGNLFEAPYPTPDGGLALDVVGKARFSTADAGVVPAWARRVTLANPAVTADSHITVTFTADPGAAAVAWVERQPGSGFVVHLSRRPRSAVPFTYLIVEPGG